MKKVTTVFFVMVVAVLAGLAIEVINPHSFLLTTGAFVRAGILLLLTGGWVWFSKKNEGHLLIPGCALLLLAACIYFFYGTSSYCEDRYYEETDHYQKVTEEYNCPRILKEHLLGR